MSPTARAPASLALRLLPVLPLVLSAIVYLPVTRTYFFADDFVCLFQIVNAGFLRFVLQLFGGHILVVRNVLYYLSYQLFGFDPRPYYWVSFLTHLLNVWLLFRVTRRLTGSSTLASLGAAMWGTSPLCIGTIGWYSVYGQMMVATILLVLLEQITQPAYEAEPPSAWIAGGWYLLLLTATTCFGVGIGVAMAFPVVLFLLMPSVLRRRRMWIAFAALPLVAAATYFGFRRVYTAFAPLPFQEFILTNVAFSAYWPILSMLWHLVAFSVTGLIHGFLLAPEHYPSLGSSVTIAFYGAGALAALVTSDGPTRRRLLALAALCLATYGMIAVGRSNLYIMFKVAPYVSARQVRYHYVGLIPVAIALCIVLERIWRWSELRLLSPAIILTAWVVFAAYSFARSDWHIDRRANIREWVNTGLDHIDGLVRGQPEGQDVYIENPKAPPMVLGPMLGHDLFPGWAGLFVLTHRHNEAYGRRVHFIERNKAVLTASRDAASNHRLAGLLVGPDEVPAGSAAHLDHDLQAR